MKTYLYLLAATVVAGFVWSPCQAQADGHREDNTMQVQRKKIDSLDEKLIEILGARQRAVKEIGIYKAKHNIPSLATGRFKEVVGKSVEAGQREGLTAAFVTKILDAIHEESLRIEDGLK
jgi:chorismate mutase